MMMIWKMPRLTWNHSFNPKNRGPQSFQAQYRTFETDQSSILAIFFLILTFFCKTTFHIDRLSTEFQLNIPLITSFHEAIQDIIDKQTSSFEVSDNSKGLISIMVFAWLVALRKLSLNASEDQTYELKHITGPTVSGLKIIGPKSYNSSYFISFFPLDNGPFLK